MVCAPWVDVDTMTLCHDDELPADLLSRAADAASELLYWASGRQFPGVCTDTIRPCGISTGGARVEPYAWGWWRYTCVCSTLAGLSCACGGHSAVMLPNTPVVAISTVHVDGAALASTSWKIVDDRWLLRTDGERWPCCQDLGADPATEDDTFQIVYTFGEQPPPSGVMAAEVLTCELAKGWRHGKCRLPQRLTSITREGVTAVVLDEFRSLAEHRFGIYEIDAFVANANPAGLTRSGKVLLVDEFERGMTHRVR